MSLSALLFCLAFCLSMSNVLEPTTKLVLVAKCNDDTMTFTRLCVSFSTIVVMEVQIIFVLLLNIMVMAHSQIMINNADNAERLGKVGTTNHFENFVHLNQKKMEMYIAVADFDPSDYLVCNKNELHSWMHILLMARKRFLIIYKLLGMHIPEYYRYMKKLFVGQKQLLSLIFSPFKTSL